MWVFWKRGFFSAVTHHSDPDLVSVRTRTKEDAEILAKVASRGKLVAGKPDVVSSPGRDYPFRVYLYRAEFKYLMSRLSDEVDYPNFKDEASRHGSADWPILLARVWRAAADILGTGWTWESRRISYDGDAYHYEEEDEPDYGKA